MIQVCSRCGTRWNVRDRQRVWCPRCRGTLHAPVPHADLRWSGHPSAQPGVAPRTPPQLPPGYRWIAVRPGPPPPPRRRRRPLGPTPRYAAIPRWGLVDRVDLIAGQPSPLQPGPTPAKVRATLLTSIVVLAIAALVYLVRYVLLVINRSTLLNPVVAAAALWLGVLASLAAVATVVFCAVVLIRWLIVRRAAAFGYRRRPEPRPERAMWAGCLVPLVNLLWAPVYVIELAKVEDIHARLRRPILVWWAVWVVSTAVSMWAIATSRAHDAQGIANNTLTTAFAYLLAALTVAAIAKVFEGFERKPVERPTHRWVVVDDDQARAAPSGAAVELAGQEPAA
ncbi:DUF4328 domain-containing protein [Mycobacterium xenopi]|uniref:DUF4328 domain-containing protein n=1 Tax=Mycobacterium xenopi TaxID=1789 RepID=UPI0009DB5871|nr:DUF4328 domain-containing protein [Mycobacterium xenopi]MDA3662383.1 DUF4328 domain-containing protein [Mycobacterium xenopi]